MNYNTKQLLIAVAKNDMKTAKRHTEIICDSDKTQANKEFCNSIKKQLHASYLNLIEVPQNIKGLLIVEDVSQTFKSERYYLTEREAGVADRVESMYKASQKLTEMGIQYLNSLMLFGESGTGKTMFGRYMAYKLGIPFAYLNFSNLVDSYLGGTGKNIQNIFDYAETLPCVLMLDEIDAVGMERGKSQEVGEIARIVISIMQSLDRIKNETLVIGATNRIDIIDKALLRRFVMRHEVKALSAAEREVMAKKFLDDVRISVDGSEITEFCKTDRTTAHVINEIIQMIAVSIINNSPFSLNNKKEAEQT